MKTKVYRDFKGKRKSDEYIQKIASIIRATTFNHVPQLLKK
jgi:lipopolysaccharide/colanic/teichoic acid biosynthesis glycosyltransferase